MQPTTFTAAQERPSARTRSDLLVGVTLDIHDGDGPRDISVAAEWLTEHGVQGTFFVHSRLLERHRFRVPLLHAHALGHEMASHSHHHDRVEVDALVNGRGNDLEFLGSSKRIHENVFGHSPRSFRSPVWCPLGRPAIEELARLGYDIDSSGTPQRVPLLSSRPFTNTWLFASRRPHYIHPGLLEIPTSTLLVPFGSPTFRIFRRMMSVTLARLLLAEARVFTNRVVVIQLHADELNPHTRCLTPKKKIRLMDFALRRRGGFAFRRHLVDRDPTRIHATTRAVLELLLPARCATLSDIADTISVGPRRKENAAACLPGCASKEFGADERKRARM